MTELVKAGRDMGYQGEELQKFVKEQQERQERLLERERAERLLQQEREERQREREHELRLRSEETRRTGEKIAKTEDDAQGECL